MTHIFFFNNASRAAGYGIGTYVRQLSLGLTEFSKFQLSFVDMYADVEEFLCHRDDKGNLHYKIPSPPSGREDETYCRVVFYFLARKLRTLDIEKMAFFFNYFQHYALARFLKGFFMKSRIILAVHYLGWCFELKGNHSLFRKTMRDRKKTESHDTRKLLESFEKERSFLYLSDEVLVLSKWTMQVLVEDYGVSADKLHLVYNGLGTDCVLRKRHPQESVRDILFVGRLDEIKGLAFLLKAFARIADKHRDTRLIVAGDGDFQTYLSASRGFPGRVVFLGKVEPDMVNHLYEEAYMGVLPSFHEQCSYTAIEMMRYGLPFVGTDSTGLAEMLDATPDMLVRISEDGFDEESFVEQLASKLEFLLSRDACYLDHASKALRQRYMRHHTLSLMTEKVVEMLGDTFARQPCLLSKDFLACIDDRMRLLVAQRSDIDMGQEGLGGICAYLWWRQRNGCLASGEELLETSLRWLASEAHAQDIPDDDQPLPSEEEILRNALKIYNSKI